MTDAIRSSDDEYLDALDLMEAGDYASALPILARLVAFEPDDDEIFVTWIDAHIGLQRYRRAIAIAEEGIAQGRPRPELELWKALAYRCLEELEPAEAAARAAMESEAMLAQASVVLSSILSKQERHSEALEICRRAAAENPDHQRLAMEVIALTAAVGDHQLVIDVARDYLRRFDKEPAVLALLGSAYADLNDYRRAERAFRDAVALEPDEPDRHVDVVMLMMVRGDYAAAEVYIARLAVVDEELAASVNDAVTEILAPAEEQASQ